MSVTQDSAARIYLPRTSAEWTELLTGLSINNPSSWWTASNASGATLADSGSGGRNASINNSPTLGATAPGFTATGIKCTDGSATMSCTFAGPDTNTTSAMMLQVLALNTPATAERKLNRLGDGQPEFASLQSGNKLRGTSGVATANGTQVQSGRLVIVTKFDRANSVLGVYTKWEQIKPTYTAPGGVSTTYYLAGNGTAASDATFVYGALWSGTDAEISDSKINDLLEALYGAETTLEKMQAGSFAHKWCVTIEGCQYGVTNTSLSAAAQAYAGTDWASSSNWLGGLFVDLHNEQSIEPLEPFTRNGRCTLRIVQDSSDTLGKFIARRKGGHETTLTATIDRDDTTIPVRSTSQFPSSGTVYIGTEAVSYTGTTATSLTGCTRGLYSPHRTALSGSGGIRFANHHRVSADVNGVQLNPVVSSIPRVWIGKRVSVRLHTWDAANNTINSRGESQLMFAGRISAISDDHEQVGVTVIELEHEMEVFKNSTLGKDLYHGEIAPGVTLITGRTFGFQERIHLSAGTTINNATALTVVSSGAAGTNQLNAGRYSLPELCDYLSRWLGAEAAAGRIAGSHTFASPVSSDEGMRTRVFSRVANGTSNIYTWCQMSMPSEIFAALGIWADNASETGSAYSNWAWDAITNLGVTRVGQGVPYSSLVFRVFGPLASSVFDTGTIYLDIENERGAIIDNKSRLPGAIKALTSSVSNWGVFLIDEKVAVVAHYDSTNRRLTGCQICPFVYAVNNDTQAMSFIGRRADEPNQGPMSVRQIAVLEGTKSDLFLQLAYGTGTSGYNHSTYDTLGFGLGAAVPGELLGPEFETSLTNMPGADAPIVVVIDEPIKFSDVFAGDLNYAWSFVRWKDQHFEVKQWKTPLNALSVATLNEANKAAPAGGTPNYRVVSRETSENQHAIIQVDSCRDFGFGRTGDYFSTYTVEDRTAVDDKGGGVAPDIIRLRNTFAEFSNTGSSVKAGLGEFISHMPSVSQVTREIDRSIDHRSFESIAPGDIVTVVDDFARDPLTGSRGVNSRAGFTTSVSSTIGGPSPAPGSEPAGIDGRATVNFLDTQRGATYAPSADVDDTAANAGYNAGTFALTCYANHYSHVMTIPRTRGTVYINEAADASRFAAGDKILIVERDPSNTASPTYWERTIASVSGNVITLTAALAAPAWNSALRYVVVPQKYSQVQTSQREAVYQAAFADEMVEDTEVSWHYSVDDELYDFQSNTTADPGEFVVDTCYGDGRPRAAGHERAIARTINAFNDYKSGHQNPFLWTQAQGNYNEAGTQWVTMFFGRMFLGTAAVSATVNRVLRVAPWFRSRTGATAKVRVTIMSSPPTGNVGGGYLPGENFSNSVVIDRYSRSDEWTSTSTTWGEGSTKDLDLTAKDIFFGFVYIHVEGYGYIECRGLSQVNERPRTVP